MAITFSKDENLEEDDEFDVCEICDGSGVVGRDDDICRACNGTGIAK